VYMTVTTEGARVYQGDKGTGMTEAQAAADVAARNERAAKLDVKARYRITPYVETSAKS
jgi:hypothetical protein